MQFSIYRFSGIQFFLQMLLQVLFLGDELRFDHVQFLLLEIAPIVFLLADGLDLGTEAIDIVPVVGSHPLILIQDWRSESFSDLAALPVGRLSLVAQFQKGDFQHSTSRYGRLYQWDIIALTMDSPLQWKDNKYEPGLFTFYMQEESLCPIPKNKARMAERTQINKRKFKSESKIPEKYRINHRYHCFNDTIMEQASCNQGRNCHPPHSFRKIPDHEMKTQRFSVRNTHNERFITTKDEGFMNALKNTNLNKYFHFDINKQRSKMFIYRGQPSNFVKKLSRKLNKNPQTIDKKKPSAYSNNWRIKTQYNISDNSKQSINSDEKSLSKTKDKLNFQEFLIQRNRQHQALKSDANKKRIQLTLTKLTQFNYPKMLEITESVQTLQ